MLQLWAVVIAGCAAAWQLGLITGAGRAALRWCIWTFGGPGCRYERFCKSSVATSDAPAERAEAAAALAKFAWRAMEQEAWGAARQHLTDAIVRDLNNAEYFAARSACHLAEENYLWAFYDADNAIELDPTNADGYLQRGLAETKLKRGFDAFTTFNMGRDVCARRLADLKDAARQRPATTAGITMHDDTAATLALQVAEMRLSNAIKDIPISTMGTVDDGYPKMNTALQDLLSAAHENPEHLRTYVATHRDEVADVIKLFMNIIRLEAISFHVLPIVGWLDKTVFVVGTLLLFVPEHIEDLADDLEELAASLSLRMTYSGWIVDHVVAKLALYAMTSYATAPAVKPEAKRIFVRHILRVALQWSYSSITEADLRALRRNQAHEEGQHPEGHEHDHVHDHDHESHPHGDDAGAPPPVLLGHNVRPAAAAAEAVGRDAGLFDFPRDALDDEAGEVDMDGDDAEGAGMDGGDAGEELEEIEDEDEDGEEEGQGDAGARGGARGPAPESEYGEDSADAMGDRAAGGDETLRRRELAEENGLPFPGAPGQEGEGGRGSTSTGSWETKWEATGEGKKKDPFATEKSGRKTFLSEPAPGNITLLDGVKTELEMYQVDDPEHEWYGCYARIPRHSAVTWIERLFKPAGEGGDGVPTAGPNHTAADHVVEEFLAMPDMELLLIKLAVIIRDEGSTPPLALPYALSHPAVARHVMASALDGITSRQVKKANPYWTKDYADDQPVPTTMWRKALRGLWPRWAQRLRAGLAQRITAVAALAGGGSKGQGGPRSGTVMIGGQRITVAMHDGSGGDAVAATAAASSAPSAADPAPPPAGPPPTQDPAVPTAPELEPPPERLGEFMMQALCYLVVQYNEVPVFTSAAAIALKALLIASDDGVARFTKLWLSLPLVDVLATLSHQCRHSLALLEVLAGSGCPRIAAALTAVAESCLTFPLRERFVGGADANVEHREAPAAHPEPSPTGRITSPREPLASSSAPSTDPAAAGARGGADVTESSDEDGAASDGSGGDANGDDTLSDVSGATTPPPPPLAAGLPGHAGGAPPGALGMPITAKLPLIPHASYRQCYLHLLATLPMTHGRTGAEGDDDARPPHPGGVRTVSAFPLDPTQGWGQDACILRLHSGGEAQHDATPASTYEAYAVPAVWTRAPAADGNGDALLADARRVVVVKESSIHEWDVEGGDGGARDGRVVVVVSLGVAVLWWRLKVDQVTRVWMARMIVSLALASLPQSADPNAVHNIAAVVGSVADGEDHAAAAAQLDAVLRQQTAAAADTSGAANAEAEDTAHAIAAAFDAVEAAQHGEGVAFADDAHPDAADTHPAVADAANAPPQHNTVVLASMQPYHTEPVDFEAAAAFFAEYYTTGPGAKEESTAADASDAVVLFVNDCPDGTTAPFPAGRVRPAGAQAAPSTYMMSQSDGARLTGWLQEHTTADEADAGADDAVEAWAASEPVLHLPRGTSVRVGGVPRASEVAPTWPFRRVQEKHGGDDGGEGTGMGEMPKREGESHTTPPRLLPFESDVAKAWSVLEVLAKNDDGMKGMLDVVTGCMGIPDKRVWVRRIIKRCAAQLEEKALEEQHAAAGEHAAAPTQSAHNHRHHQHQHNHQDLPIAFIECDRKEDQIVALHRQFREKTGIGADWIIGEFEVRFKGESSVGSALIREWMDIVSTHVFLPPQRHILTPFDISRSSFLPSLASVYLNPHWKQDYQLLGRLLGLALYHQVTLDLPVHPVVYDCILHGCDRPDEVQRLKAAVDTPAPSDDDGDVATRGLPRVGNRRGTGADDSGEPPAAEEDAPTGAEGEHGPAQDNTHCGDGTASSDGAGDAGSSVGTRRTAEGNVHAAPADTDPATAMAITRELFPGLVKNKLAWVLKAESLEELGFELLMTDAVELPAKTADGEEGDDEDDGEDSAAGEVESNSGNSSSGSHSTTANEAPGMQAPTGAGSVSQQFVDPSQWLDEMFVDPAVDRLHGDPSTDLPNLDPQALEVDVVPQGRDVYVTAENKEDYVAAVTRHRAGDAMAAQIAAIRKGFASVVPSYILPEMRKMLCGRDLLCLISGEGALDLDDWKKHTRYEGYLAAEAREVRYFWKVMGEWAVSDPPRLAKLLQFATGSRRVPVGGFQYLVGYNGGLHRFTLDRGVHLTEDSLPTSHACICTVDLPPWRSLKAARAKLAVVTDSEMQFDEGH